MMTSEKNERSMDLQDWEMDAHSCRVEADEYGYCQCCGAIVHGSMADYEEHGYDPPEPYISPQSLMRTYKG